MTIELVDTHTHLDGKEFDQDREAVFERAREAGITRIINIGATEGIEGARRSIELAEKFDFIWAAVGVHPHDATIKLDDAYLEELASHPRVVAIGETGLDFYRDWSPFDKQELWFRKQIELALKIKKPLVIHSREAGAKCLAILKEMNASAVGGVFHCYAEDELFARELADINFLVSFPGTITFKKADALRKTVEAIPLSQIMLETDAPYMAPEPFRGKRCESAHVLEIAKRVAIIKNISLEEVARESTDTACKFFGIN